MKNVVKAAGAGSSRCDNRCFIGQEDRAQACGCGVTQAMGSQTQSCDFHQAKHELMNLLPLCANELSLSPCCNGSLAKEGLRGWVGRNRTSVEIPDDLKLTSVTEINPSDPATSLTLKPLGLLLRNSNEKVVPTHGHCIAQSERSIWEPPESAGVGEDFPWNIFHQKDKD